MQKKRVNGVDLGLNIGDNQNVVLNEDSIGVGNHGCNKVIDIDIFMIQTPKQNPINDLI